MGSRLTTALEEAYDERNDREIYQAVVQSMREWEAHKKHNRRWKRDVSRVCYEDVGCFEDTGPFGYLEMLPSPPKDVGTRYSHLSRHSRTSSTLTLFYYSIDSWSTVAERLDRSQWM